MPTEYELERILQLPVATSIDGSEYAVVVQAGVTKRTLVSNLGGGSSAYELEITGDDNPSNDTRIVVHGKNTATPSVQLWYEYSTGQWRQLDVTQGITTETATPNQLSLNLLAYEGNQTSNKYSIIVQ